VLPLISIPLWSVDAPGKGATLFPYPLLTLLFYNELSADDIEVGALVSN